MVCSGFSKLQHRVTESTEVIHMRLAHLNYAVLASHQPSEKPERVCNPQTSAHFRGEFLDKRQVVSIQPVRQVKGIK
jgi:hypothetical protein